MPLVLEILGILNMALGVRDWDWYALGLGIGLFAFARLLRNEPHRRALEAPDEP